MEKSSEIIKNTITFENFEALLKEGIRPGEVPLNQLVCLLDAVNVNTKDFADELKSEKLVQALGKEDRAAAVQSAFHAHRIPLKEKTVKEIKEAFAMLDELEEINDGLCEYLLRNGVDPTINNMVRLQYEKQSIKPVQIIKKRESSWSFTDTGALKEGEELRLLEEAGMEVSDFSRKQIQWLNEKGIYASAQNLRLLNELWSLSLPIEDEAAAVLFIESIKDGRNIKDSLLCRIGEVPEREYDFRNHGKREQLFVNEIWGNLHMESDTESTGILRGFEDAYHTEYLKEHSEAEYRRKEYREFLKELDLVGSEAAILNALFIPVTLNNLAAMRLLTSPEGEEFFERISLLIGGRNLSTAFRREKDQKIGETESYVKTIRMLGEKLSEKTDEAGEDKDAANTVKQDLLKEEIIICRTLLFMDEMKSRGYEEIPVLLGKKWIRIRLKKEGEGNFSALTENEITGGMVIKYTESGDNISVLVVGDKEEVLSEFKESKLLEERLKKAGKTNCSVTYLYREEFVFGNHFYPTF